MTVLVLCAGLVSPAGAALADRPTASDELSPEEDNGGEGVARNGLHEPPRKACDNVRSKAGSLVVRRLPVGPRKADGSLAFTSGVCVYLPPGYESSRLRYPVVYMLHGLDLDQGSWVALGDIQQHLDAAYAEDPKNAVIAVMPDAGPSGDWSDSVDGSQVNETYVFDYVIPFMDRHYRTLDTQRGRAIGGLSAGGIGAMRLAGHRPDMFVGVEAMSPALATPKVPVTSVVSSWNQPHYFAANYDSTALDLVWGALCDPQRRGEPATWWGGEGAGDEPPCAAWAFEQILATGIRTFNAEMTLQSPRGPYAYHEEFGGHDWPSWQLWLDDYELPFLLPRLLDPQDAGRPVKPTAPPESSFRYRSIEKQFSIWGYDVTVARPAVEYLELDLSHGQIGVQGSGRVSLKTAPRYLPHASYYVTGTGGADGVLAADNDGRLAIEVDLGPGHVADQYTAEAATAEATTSDYWTKRTVTIVRA